jgi:hypothetical protein
MLFLAFLCHCCNKKNQSLVFPGLAFVSVAFARVLSAAHHVLFHNKASLPRKHINVVGEELVYLQDKIR